MTLADSGKVSCPVGCSTAPPAVMTVCTSCTVQSCPASQPGKMSSNRKLQSGVIYHPVLGYPIPPPVPVAVARRNARERNRVKTVNDSYQHLKNHVPGAARQKRMSKVDIIKHTIDYIQRLQRSLEESELAAASGEVYSPGPGESEDCLTPCSGDSGYQSPHYNYYKHTPSSTSVSTSSSSSSCSLPPAQYPPGQVQTDCDVLDAILDWQDSPETPLRLGPDC